jgi:hypothetical protein
MYKKMAALWGVAPRILVNIDRSFEGAHYLHYSDEGSNLPVKHRSISIGLTN